MRSSAPTRRLRGWFSPALQSHPRTLVKTAAYRALMFAVTFAIALFFTGRVEQAASIGVATNLVKTGTYYGYERLWARIEWGLE